MAKKRKKRSEKIDSRIRKLASIILNYSTKTKKNDEVLIFADLESKELALEIYKQALKKGAYPAIRWNVKGHILTYFQNASQIQLKRFPQKELYIMKNSDVVIDVNATKEKELAIINPKKLSLRSKVLRKIKDLRIKKRWLIVNYPSKEFAKDAGISLPAYKNFVFSACILNWPKFAKKIKKLKKLIDKGNKVRILHKDTDLKFSIKGRKADLSDGTNNMPGGEVFTAPVESTVDGYITFTYPRYIYGKPVERAFLKFKKGKLISIKAKKNVDKLKAIVKTDKGASKIGEFAFGLNPKVKKFTNELLFDEKITGTIHMALGSAYKECKGTNKSSIHLDIVKDMRNGGKVYIDGKLIYKNGKFLGVK